MKAYQILQFRQAKKNAHSSIFHRTTDEKKGLPMWWYLHFKLKRNHHRRSHIFLLLHKRQPKVLNFACSNTKKNVLTQPKRRGRREKNLGKLVIRISLQNAFCAVVALFCAVLPRTNVGSELVSRHHHHGSCLLLPQNEQLVSVGLVLKMLLAKSEEEKNQLTSFCIIKMEKILQ